MRVKGVLSVVEQAERRQGQRGLQQDRKADKRTVGDAAAQRQDGSGAEPLAPHPPAEQQAAEKYRQRSQRVHQQVGGVQNLVQTALLLTYTNTCRVLAM